MIRRYFAIGMIVATVLFSGSLLVVKAQADENENPAAESQNDQSDTSAGKTAGSDDGNTYSEPQGGDVAPADENSGSDSSGNEQDKSPDAQDGSER